MARRWPERIKVVRTDRDPDDVHVEIWSIVRAALALPPDA
jgi:thymidylate kinase